jgi:AmmeMemoRadiSam system protein A
LSLFAPDDCCRLLAIARRALEARVRRERTPAPEGGGALDTRCGAFVSIHSGGDLRGCLGRLEADWPIARVVSHLGGAVADSDPRFRPIDTTELAALEIEISILAPAREVQTSADILIGRHGLIVDNGLSRGLLLPQVAAEHDWDVETFIAHTCIKAGLPPDAWERGAKLLCFEAQVFGETAPMQL